MGNDGSGAEKAPKIQQISKFKLDFKGGNGATPTGRWWSISGGDTNCEIVTYTSGPDQHEQKRPGQMYFSDVTIKGPFLKSREAVMKWVNETATGKRGRENMTLEFQNDAGDRQNAYTLFQCIPVSYQPPSVSAGNYDMLEETLTFHVEEVKKEA